MLKLEKDTKQFELNGIIYIQYTTEDPNTPIYYCGKGRGGNYSYIYPKKEGFVQHFNIGPIQLRNLNKGIGQDY